MSKSEEMLLTQEEGELAVAEWVKEDFATRSVQLDRGHWEYIVPIIAKAQLAKAERSFVNEKVEFGLSVNESAWEAATKEAQLAKSQECPELRKKLIDWVTAYKDAAERNALAETPEESVDYLLTLMGRLEEEACPECRVCHHKRPSWFEDNDGVICDWCLNDIPCPTGKANKEEDVCLDCKGVGYLGGEAIQDFCEACQGTGKKPDREITPCTGLELCCDLEAKIKEAKREERERIERHLGIEGKLDDLEEE